jgi:septal ring factor EnvC (AmiA/AmiB activator)
MKFIIFSFLIALMIIPVNGQDRKELEMKKKSTLRELEIAKELLERTKDKRTNTINRIAVLNQDIRSRERLISTLTEEIRNVEQDILDLEREIAELDKSIEVGKEEYARIIYSIYKNHTEEEKLMYLLASENINQFYQRIKYMKYLKDYREIKIAELAVMVERIQDRKEELMVFRDEKEFLLNDIKKENRTLLQQRNERNAIVRQLSQEEQRIRREIKEKERISQELEDAIRKVIEEEARKHSSGSFITSLTPEQKLLGNNFLQNKGRLPWPVERGIITSNYGLVNHPVLSGVKIPNNGIDISVNPGEKARAIYDGEVKSVFAILGANYAVMIMHGEYISVYQNLIDVKVKTGDKVVVKQELGTVHYDSDEGVAVLHLQIWKSREILNPNVWLSK